jgi:uncharacterized membrane protein
MKNIKRNWFMGIRTPWTLSSDVIWEKTHKLGGKLFQASAVICMFGLFFKGESVILIIIIPIILSAVISVVYSYVIYGRNK